MNKLILLIIVILISMSANAQRMKGVQVPKVVRDSLTHLFPNLQKVRWEKENGNYEALFDWHGRSKSITYDPSGNWQEKETSVSMKDFPPAALKYIHDKLPGSTIKEISKILSRDGKKTFEAEVKGEDYIFDEQGTFLKKVKD